MHFSCGASYLLLDTVTYRFLESVRRSKCSFHNRSKLSFCSVGKPFAGSRSKRRHCYSRDDLSLERVHRLFTLSFYECCGKRFLPQDTFLEALSNERRSFH